MNTENIKRCIADAAVDADTPSEIRAAAAVEALNIANVLVEGIARLAIAIENHNNL